VLHEPPGPTPVLDPVERAAEAIFGVLMAMSITGSLSVATAGHQEIRAMLATAVGCNLAWGLTDAVMYLIAAATENARRLALVRRLHDTSDRVVAHRILAEALPERLATLPEETLETVRRHILALPLPSAALGRRDLVAAVGVFALVVAVTFPVVLPFLLVRDVALALRVSNGVALATLYGYGHMLGQHSGGTGWAYGLAVAAIGAVLVAVIMALGG
jgi:hypothetical protein